jgi:NAD(P)-dependent dehydrogenase (short-subunit alcohol dehydrogenase family)
MGIPVQQLFDRSGQTALVTGGSRGLDLQMAEALGEAGAKIMLTSRKAADLEEAIADLAARGIDARWIAADASDPAQIQLAGEWGARGINVNALAPGFFPSKMTQGVLDHFGADKLAAAAPLERLGDDDDLKGAVLLLASAAGKHITGQILAVDGGVSAVHGA